MSEEGRDFGAAALVAATRDLTAPLVLLRQLSFQLDSQMGQTSVDVHKTLEQLRLTVDRTFDIADQLKQATSDSPMAIGPIQLAGLCADLDRETKPLQRQWQTQIDFELPRRHPVVAIGDYQALKTIISTFLADSLRYHSAVNADGVSDRLVRVKVATNHQGEASISIRDSGPAINLKRALASVGDWCNVNPTVSRPLMSSLNLLSANNLIEAMSGRINIHNHQRGRGVTIETILPISRQLALFGEA